MKNTIITLNFADYFMEQRKVHRDLLAEIDASVDWTTVGDMVSAVVTKGRNASGRPGYSALQLWKMELLRVWYGLSDGEVEDLVNDRLSFSRFAGFSIEEVIPDRSTLGRFRRTLKRAQAYEKLMNETTRLLAEARIYVSRGKFADIRITKRAPKRRRHIRRSAAKADDTPEATRQNKTKRKQN